VDPVLLVAEAAALFRKDPRFEGVRVEAQGPPSLPPAFMDPDQIQRLLLNLLINAADAQGGKGTIVIRLEGGEDTWSLEVLDEGPGIDPSIRHQIFQPFFSTKKQGSGLGLALARQSALAHAGSLRAAQNPQGGSVFILELPRQIPQASA